MRRFTPVVIDNGGRCVPGETRDCTVRALAWATWQGYKWAHDELRKAGRKYRKGFNLATYLRDKPWAFTRISFRMTIGRFAKENPKGCFILRCRGHVVPVIDGEIVDDGNSSCRIVITVWQITYTKENQ